MKLSAFCLLALRFLLADAFISIFPLIFKFIYEHENICGDVFAEPAWVPSQERCKIGCELTSEICLVNIKLSPRREKCRRLPVECSMYLRRLLRLSPVDFTSRKKKKTFSKLSSRRRTSLLTTTHSSAINITPTLQMLEHHTMKSVVTTTDVSRSTTTTSPRAVASLPVRTEDGSQIAVGSNGIGVEAYTETKAAHLVEFIDTHNNPVDLAMTNLVKLPALSSIDKRLMFLQQSEKRALSKPTASVPVILGGPLEGQPFNVPNFSIDLGRTGRTLDYFENQMQRTSPQTIIDPSERRSQRLQTTQQSRSLEKAEDAMIDERHRGRDSDGSSMPLYSAVNDDTFFKQLDKSSGSPNGQKSEGVGEKVAPPQGDYFVIDRGSLPFQHISFYVRSRQIPISRLPLSYTHGSGRNKLSYQSLFKYPSTHHLQNGVSGTVSNEMPLTENSYLRKPLSQSRTEWPVQTTSTPAREQDIHPGQVNRLVNDIRYESGKHSLGEAVPIIADGSIDQVSHFELPDANLPSKNHEMTLSIASVNNAEHLFESEEKHSLDREVHSFIPDQGTKVDETSLMDQSVRCCQWALDGLCERNWQRIRQLCPKSCGTITCASVDGAQTCNRVLDVDAVDCIQLQRQNTYYTTDLESNNVRSFAPVAKLEGSSAPSGSLEVQPGTVFRHLTK